MTALTSDEFASNFVLYPMDFCIDGLFENKAGTDGAAVQ
jgi:hypothetical protein